MTSSYAAAHDRGLMADPPHAESAAPAMRRIVCGRCGAAFTCRLDGNCWCAAEAFRLPVPSDGDCLCPACLRDVAAAHAAV